MTKEELENEAEEWLNKWELCNKCENKVDCISNFSYCKKVVLQSYLASAEPREKQIQIDAEQIRALQKQNGELTDKVKTLEETLKGYKKVAKWCDNCEQLKQWKKEWQEQVQKATDEGYARTLQTMKLSKAKELLKKAQGYTENLDDEADKLYDEIEQFLNEVEK